MFGENNNEFVDDRYVLIIESDHEEISLSPIIKQIWLMRKINWSMIFPTLVWFLLLLPDIQVDVV